MKTQKIPVRVRTDFVRRVLTRRNLSQNHLAHKLEISKGYLSQLLSGERHPSPVVRERMMDVLRVDDFDELFVLDETAVEVSA